MAIGRSGGLLGIGLVGAGQVVQDRHLPGLRALKSVEIVGICSRRRETSSRVARAFEIARTYPGWESLIEDDSIDAVVVATWPDLHAAVSLAALDAGKHVLTQCPMAMNAREAHRMLEKAAEHPRLIAMVSPGPYGIATGLFLERLMGDGQLGSLREAHVTSLASDLSDKKTPMGWRQITRHVGFSMMDLGAIHDAASRILPGIERVFAHASKQIEYRPLEQGGRAVKVGNPDSVQVLVDYEGGGVGTYRVSGLSRGVRERSLQLFGSEGSLVVDLIRDRVLGATRKAPKLRPIPTPEDLRGCWSVEADFVAAILGERPPGRLSFREGAAQMHFIEAVARSSRHQEAVHLPLNEFSNPSL